MITPLFFQHDPQFSVWKQAKQREESNHGGGNGDNDSDGDKEDNEDAVVGAHQQEEEKAVSDATQASQILQPPFCTIRGSEILPGDPRPH